MARLARITVLFLAACLAPGAAAQETQVGDEIAQTAVALSGEEAVLDLELVSGRRLKIRLADGRVFIGGREVGQYGPGGRFESAWRDLLREARDAELASAWTRFGDAEYAAERDVADAIRQALAPVLAGVSAEAAGVASDVTADLPNASQETVARVTAQTVRAASRAGEVVVGGLVVQLTEVEGLGGALGRVGLAPELSRVLNGDLKPPVRIVIDADEYRLMEGARLDETLILVQSDGEILGTVGDNVIVAEGSLRVAPTGRIEGEVVALDATVHNQGTVVGGLREASHFGPVLAPVAPRLRIPSGRPSFMSNAWNGLSALTRTIAVYLLLAFVGALVVYFFRSNLEVVSDTVSYSFGRSFLTGLAGLVLLIPALLMMTLLIITVIAVPFVALGFWLAALLGYLGVAHAAGENLTRHRFPSWAARLRRSNSYYFVLNGLGVLLALFAGAAVTEMLSPLLGWAHGLLIAAAMILTWVAGTAGLGASLLSRFGTRRTYARPRELPQLPLDSLAEELAPIERRAASRRRATELGDEI